MEVMNTANLVSFSKANNTYISFYLIAILNFLRGGGAPRKSMYHDLYIYLRYLNIEENVRCFELLNGFILTVLHHNLMILQHYFTLEL